MRTAIICLVLLSLPEVLFAQTTYYWEPGTANDGTLSGGAGAWNSTNTFFTTSPTDSGTAIAWPTTDNRNTVIFGGNAGGTVTLSALTAYTPSGGNATTTNHLLNNLTFATSGYLLTGNTIRFVYNGTTNGSITVNSGITATINSAITGATTSGLVNGTTNNNISNNVLINGGGTLNIGGGNSSLGFTVDGGTTVQVTGGTFSGFNLNRINNGSVVRATANNVLQAPASYTTTDGVNTLLDLGSTTQTISTLGGVLAVSNSNANGVLTLTMVNNALVHTGIISNGTGKLSLATAGVVAQGSGFSSTNVFATQTLAGSNTYTGFTSLGRGTVVLDFSNTAAPASDILYNTGFGTPIGDDGKLIIARPTATVGGANGANSATGTLATLTLTGKSSTANSQQFNGLKLTDGAANILLNPGATGGTVALNLGSTLERSAGSLINFATTNATTALSSSATINAGFGSASTVLKDGNGVAFAVIGGRDWAAKNVANTAIVAATYTNSTPIGLTANADITTPTAGGAANDTRLSANTTISTLRYGNSTARTGINLGGNTLTTGGILTSQDLAASGSYLTGGTVTSPGPSGSDIVLYSNAQTTFGLGAVLANNAAATGFTKGGSGVVIASANNTYTGVLTVNEGGLILTGSNTASGINVNGSQTNLLGSQLTNTSNTAGAYVQLGNANALGSLGSGDINLGVNALLAIKRSDNITLNNNVRGTGGITQGWSGTTTLLSAATAKYEYVGDTTVIAGTLKLDYSASNSSILSNSTRLVLGGGTVESTSTASTTHSEVIRDWALLSGASTVTRTGSTTGILQLGALADAGVAGATVNFTAASIANSSAANTLGIMGSRARFTVGGADWAVAGGNITALPGASYTALSLGAGTDTVNSLQALANTTTFTGSRTTNTLKLTNSSGASQILDIAAGNTLTLTAGGLLLTGANAVEINNGTLRSNTATNSDLIIHQYNTGGLTIGSVIANGTGASTLTKSGDGTLTLGGTNTYTGQTFLNGGTTIISANANLGAAASGGQLNLNNATLRATADIILSNGAVGTNNRAVVLNGIGGTFEVDATRTLTIGGAISGPGGLTKTGLGTLDIRSASGFSGPTTVTAGTLRFGGGANPTRSDVTVGASGTIDIFGQGNTVGSLAGSGIVTNTGAAATLTVGTLHNDTTFSGQLTNTTNALNLDKMGGGTLTLTGANNNYTGSTTISGGTLAISGTGVLPTGTALNVSSAAGTFDISGISASGLTVRTLATTAGASVALGSKELSLAPSPGTVSVTNSATNSTSVTVASVPSYLTVGSSLLGQNVTAISGTTITLGGNAIRAISSSTAIPVNLVTADAVSAGVISGVGGSLNKNGTGSLTLSGANTYTGATAINVGNVLVSNATGLGTTAGNTTLAYTGSSSTGGRLQLSGGINVAENIILTGGSAGGFNNALESVSGINTFSGNITLTGTGAFRFGGATGTTTNYDGLIARSTASGGEITVQAGNGATVNINQAMDNNGGTFSVAAAGGTTGVTVLNASANDIGATQVFFNGNLRLGATNALNTTQTLQVGLATGSGSTDNGGVTGSLDMAGFSQTVARLDGGNAAATTATTANRRITNSTNGSSLLTVGAAATNATFDGVIENGSAGGTIAITKQLANTQTFSGTVANTYTGLTTVTGGSLILAKTAGVNAIGGNLTIGDGSITAGNDIVQLANSNQIADTSVVTFNGTGTNAGILRLNNANETIGGLSSAGGAGIVENGNAAVGTSTLTTNVASGTQTFSGILRDNGGAGSGILAVAKDGIGILSLTGASTYSGGTTVLAGTLAVNNTTGSGTGTGTVTVQTGATLTGTGSIAGATTISGIHSPGNSPGIQSFASDLTYLTNASLNWELTNNTTVNAANPSAIFDSLLVGGNLNFAGLTTLSLAFNPSGSGVLWSDPFWGSDKTGTAGWLLFDVTGTTSNFGNLGISMENWLDSGNNAFGTARPDSSFSLIQSGNDIYLNYAVTAVPEPSSFLLAGVASCVGLIYRKKRANRRIAKADKARDLAVVD